VLPTLPDGNHVYSRDYIRDSKKNKSLLDNRRYKIIKGECYELNAISLINKSVKTIKKMGLKLIFFVPNRTSNSGFIFSGYLS